MKLVRHGPKGNERPGTLDAEGNVRDLGGRTEDFGPAFFASGGLQRLRSVELASLRLAPRATRPGPCVAQPGNCIAIGLNHVQHAREPNARLPTDPRLVDEAAACISGPYR
jgi:2-keto-4-pentenoate hydratase/2-oxohepta-3-ene-1,7-dioic acid hydratase in catechol pathway